MKHRLRGRLDFRFLLLCLLWVAPAQAQVDTEPQREGLPFDTVIQGGRVMDPESGLDAVMNVGIRDGVIRAVSENTLEGYTTIDADGLVVAPGFIDLDTYARLARFQVTDGVTSMFDIRNGTADVDAWYAEHRDRMPIHYGVGIGLRPIQDQLIGETPYQDVGERPRLSVHDQQKVLAAVEHGLRRGAVAVGLGPQGRTPSFWDAVEVFRLAATHDVTVVATWDEAIWSRTDGTAVLARLIGAAAVTGSPLHVPHLKSNGGPYTPKMLELIGRARARGLDVTAEVYPYLGAIGSFKDDEPYLPEMTDEELNEILLLPTNERMTRSDIERYRGLNPIVVHLQPGLQPVVDEAIASPLTSIASHGYLDDELRGHPRTSGTYSRVLGRYVRERRLLTLMEALRKMTLMPAQRLEQWVPAMRAKGRIRVGADADLVAFDPNRIGDRATFQEPTRPPDGIVHVLVNGVAVVNAGVLQSDLYPGEPVRAPIQPKTRSDEVNRD